MFHTFTHTRIRLYKWRKTYKIFVNYKNANQNKERTKKSTHLLKIEIFQNVY